MIKLTKVTKIGRTTWLHLLVPSAKLPVQLGILDGLIESYQGVFNLSDPADVVVLLIVDGLVEDIDSYAPHMDEPSAVAKVSNILSRFSREFDWNNLRDQVLANVTAPAEISSDLKELWSQQRQFLIDNPDAVEGPVEALKRKLEAQEHMARGHERVQEERMADAFVAANPEMKRAPRAEGVKETRRPVGLTVKFV